MQPAKTRAKPTLVSPRVVILGAGRSGAAGPAALAHGGNKRGLDWLLEAFSVLPSARPCFVGGFRGDEVRSRYPKLEIVHNPKWADTGPAISLFYANLVDKSEAWISYGDVVYRPSVVESLDTVEADLVLAVDYQWRARYTGRPSDDIARAEKIALVGDIISSIGTDVPLKDAGAEYCGLLKLSAKAVASAYELYRTGLIEPHATIAHLVSLLISLGLVARTVDANGDWAELDVPQDLARFVLGTKAESLERLRPLIRRGTIGELVFVTKGQWSEDPAACLGEIRKVFPDGQVIVRSSAIEEDSWHASAAGAFTSVLNVPVADDAKLTAAICEVIESYGKSSARSQVLVQRMLQNVALSGVGMTRTQSVGGPYYVINFDSTTRRTDSVTAGDGHALRTVFVHRKSLLRSELQEELGPVLEAIQEVEELVGHDSLDIEFAVTAAGQVHILQVRPIVTRHKNWRLDDEAVAEGLTRAQEAFTQRQLPSPFVLGKRALLSVMADWNPAEIVGTKPKRLSFSTYRYVITDEVWATQRAENGYRDVRPCPLLVNVMGLPYIDVRASFNSFVPASLPEKLASRLVNHYLDRLATQPTLHDKVEFDILYTCLTFDYDRRSRELIQSGFSAEDVAQLKEGLAGVTRQSFVICEQQHQLLDSLVARQTKIQSHQAEPLELAYLYLEDVRRYGTLPFAHLARCGFVAVSLLRSLETVGITSRGQTDAFLRSVHTVSGQLQTDSYQVSRGELAWDTFVERYGHLRPGTYDICSPCYASAAEEYLRPMVDQAHPPEPMHETPWDSATRERIGGALAELGLGVDVGSFERFLKRAIEGREFSKFLFTRNLSWALECLAEFGGEFELSREDLSHLTLQDFFMLRDTTALDRKAFLKHRVREGRDAYGVTQSIVLPGFIARPEDFECFEQARAEPNFVTRKSVRASVVHLKNAASKELDLTGKLVIVPNADPGFDWLFGHNIAGLITMYGGVNSHMAIRAAEFGLPAAIGVGELMYEELLQATVVELDCEAQQIRAVGGKLAPFMN